MAAPTSQLPPIKSLKSISPDKLKSGIDHLRMIYNPPVRGSLRRNSRLRLPSFSADDDALQLLRSDAFERDYAMRWLTALTHQCGSLTENSAMPIDQAAHYESLIEEAASLIATCAGTASAGRITRTFAFEIQPVITSTTGITQAKPSRITVELMDLPLDNHDYGSVGAQTWGGACIMSEMIVEDPPSFGLPDLHNPRPPFRVLELGAGTGLVSLTVGKLVHHRLSASSSSNTNSSQFREVEIVATDYYPSVLNNLQRNIDINLPSTGDSPCRIQCKSLDWSLFAISDTSSDPTILQTPFDVVYGADIIYEAKHAEWIKACLVKLLRKPSVEAQDPFFHLIIPLRRTHHEESSSVEQIFKMRETLTELESSPSQGDEDLIIKYKEIIVCDAESASGRDEVEYAYYKIGWGLQIHSQ